MDESGRGTTRVGWDPSADATAVVMSQVEALDVAEANSWGDSRFYPLGRSFGYGFRAVQGRWGRAEIISVSHPCLIEHCDTDRVLYVPLGIGHPPLVWGREVSHNEVLPLPAGKGVFARVPGASEYASVQLPDGTHPLDESQDERTFRPDGRSLARLQRLIQTMFDLADASSDRGRVNGVGEAVVDAVYQSLGSLESAAGALTVSAASDVAAAAMDAARQHGARSVGEMCAATGVSRSALYRAFDVAVGVSPYAWLQVHRLTSLRSALSQRAPMPGVVTEEAAAVGAYHLGHLSKAYRSLFGETPVETLHRV